MAIILGLLALFIAVMLVLVRPLLLFAYKHIKSKMLLTVLTMVLLLLSAYATDKMGIHPVFGAFTMGIILPRRTAFLQQAHCLMEHVPPFCEQVPLSPVSNVGEKAGLDVLEEATMFCSRERLNGLLRQK